MWAVGWGLSIDNVITRRLLRGRMVRGLCWSVSLCMCVCGVFAFEIVRDTCAKRYDLLLGSLRGRCGLCRMRNIGYQDRVRSLARLTDSGYEWTTEFTRLVPCGEEDWESSAVDIREGGKGAVTASSYKRGREGYDEI